MLWLVVVVLLSCCGGGGGITIAVMTVQMLNVSSLSVRYTPRNHSSTIWSYIQSSDSVRYGRMWLFQSVRYGRACDQTLDGSHRSQDARGQPCC